MSTKTRVDLERVQELQEELAKINALSLDEIELYEGGQLVTIKPDTLAWWKMVGLNNITMLETLHIEADATGAKTGEIRIYDDQTGEQEPL